MELPLLPKYVEDREEPPLPPNYVGPNLGSNWLPPTGPTLRKEWLLPPENSTFCALALQDF